MTLTSSYIVVTVSSDDGNGGPGTADVPVGDERPVFVSVIEHIWEEWTGDVSGRVEIRNEHDLPKVVSLDFAIVSGPGSITPATVQTSALGEAQATFTMGAGDSTVSVSTVEAAGGQPALGTISFHARTGDLFVHVQRGAADGHAHHHRHH